MTGNLLPQPIYLFLHAHISNRVDDLLDSHLFIDQMLSVGLQSLHTFLEGDLELLTWKWHGLSILLHELRKFSETCVEC